MANYSRTGWRRLLDATGFSIKGLRAAWHNEAAFRQELILVLILLPIAFWLGENFTQRALLIFSLLVVLMVELLNSAVETAIDRIGSEPNELSGRAKDLGSAAVMISLAAVGVVWALVAIERFS